MNRFGYMYLCFSESWASPVSGSGCTFYGLLSVHWNSYYHEDIQCKQMWLNNTAQLSIQQNNPDVGDSFMKRILTITDLILLCLVSGSVCLLTAHPTEDWTRSCSVLWMEMCSRHFKCSLQCAAAGLYLLQNYEKINNKLWIAPM